MSNDTPNAKYKAQRKSLTVKHNVQLRQQFKQNKLFGCSLYGHWNHAIEISKEKSWLLIRFLFGSTELTPNQ